MDDPGASEDTVEIPAAFVPDHYDSLGAVTPNPGTWVTAYACLESFREGTTRDGMPYADVLLSDETAALPGKIWGSDRPKAIAQLRDLAPDTPVKVLFEAKTYRDAIQANIRGIRPISDDDDVDLDETDDSFVLLHNRPPGA